jgi:hypothetical protein
MIRESLSKPFCDNEIYCKNVVTKNEQPVLHSPALRNVGVYQGSEFGKDNEGVNFNFCGKI